MTRYLVNQIVEGFVESFYEPDVVAEMRRRHATKAPPPGVPTTLRARLKAARGRRRKSRSKASAGD